MSSHFLSLSRRIRKTHFTDRVIENGVKGFTVYNHMLLPTYFESVEDDYHHLKREVQIWDVSCERQVEIDGKDSFKLLKLITPRNLEKLSVNKCLYVPLVNSKGFMVNDPVIVKISDYKFWISIADSDVLLWIDGIVSALTTGGHGQISYSWSNGDTNSTANNLYAGSIAVTVTDTSGCALTDSTILISPTELTSTYSTTDVLCFNDSTGSATVTFNGGVPDYLLAVSYTHLTLPTKA